MTRSFLTLGLVAAVAALSSVDAGTTVAVLEIGAGGVTRRTTSDSTKTSVSAVSSFWTSMHDVDNGEKKRRSKSFQYPGMTIVPDLFKRADGGVVIGITGSGVELASMPSISGLLEEKSVGLFHLVGSQGHSLMDKAGKVYEVASASEVGSSIENKIKAVSAGSNKLETVSIKVDSDASVDSVDSHVAATLKKLQTYASEMGKTIVVHLVVDEETPSRRRLEDMQDEEDAEEAEADENDNADNNQNDYNGNGNSNSNYNTRTIFQIQYFNLVLWTSIGLTVVLMLTVGLTVTMPLEPDTLLFGESAKMIGE